MGFRSELQGVRGLAIALVLAYHFGVLAGGWVGVDLFFALSGYLITRLLADERSRTGVVRLSAFYVRRIGRLAPGLAFVLVTVGVVEAITTYNGSPSLLNVYSQNLETMYGDPIDPTVGHLWSIAQEEQFYIVWPLLLLIVLRIRRAWIVPGAMAAVALVWLLLHASDSTTRIYYGPDTHALPLLAGCLLALLPSRASRWALLGGSACLLAVLTTGSPQATGVAYQLILAAVASAGIVAGAPLLPWGMVWQWLGLYSYSLYLWHFPLIFWLPDALAFPLTFVAAVASYHLIEQPFRAYARAKAESRLLTSHAGAAAGLEPAMRPSAPA